MQWAVVIWGLIITHYSLILVHPFTQLVEAIYTFRVKVTSVTQNKNSGPDKLYS